MATHPNHFHMRRCAIPMRMHRLSQLLRLPQDSSACTSQPSTSFRPESGWVTPPQSTTTQRNTMASAPEIPRNVLLHVHCSGSVEGNHCKNWSLRARWLANMHNLCDHCRIYPIVQSYDSIPASAWIEAKSCRPVHTKHFSYGSAGPLAQARSARPHILQRWLRASAPQPHAIHISCKF